MKVKELVEIFNCPEEKILELLSNVGVDVSMQGDTFVEKEVEKKLARYFNVPYPFKSAKKDGKAKTSAKPKTVVPIVRAEPKKEVKPQPQPQAKQCLSRRPSNHSCNCRPSNHNRKSSSLSLRPSSSPNCKSSRLSKTSASTG